MAIDFPNSPAPGDNYTVGTKTWTFTDGKWALNVNSLGVTGATGPSGPSGLQGASGTPSTVSGPQGVSGIPGVDASSPTGTVAMYAGGTAPASWLLCDGSAVSRTTYSSLFSITSTTFGVGNGTTTFNLPDFRSRIPIGAGAGTSLTSRTLGTTGGAESVVIASGNLPVHTHTIGHGHANTITAANGTQTANHTHVTSHGHGHTISATTGGQSANHTHYTTVEASDTNHSHSANHSHTVNQTTATSGGAHNNTGGYVSAGTNGGTTSTNAAVNEAAFNTSISGSVHGHSGTSGGVSADHSHTVTVAGGVTDNTTATSGGVSADHSHTVTMSGGVTNFTGDSGGGGFANTALATMNPWLAISFIIKT